MSIGNTTQSRRRPWPWDMYVDDVRVMLVPQKDGSLIGRKTKTLEATAPSTYSYSSASPYVERTAIFRELYGGMGLSIEPLEEVPIRRYAYTHKADLSINGLWMKSPKFESHIEIIYADAGPVRQLVKALHSGNEVLFAVCDNGVWRRTADNTWVPSLTIPGVPGTPATTLTPGSLPQSALRFKAQYSGAIDALYLATDDSNLWRYNGTAWSLATALEGPGPVGGNGEARYLEKIGNEFWVAGNSWVVKCEADPMLRASYSGIIYMGDQSSTISFIKQVNNKLIVFKTDGRIMTVSDDGEDVDLFPGLAHKTDINHGKNAEVWMDQMWAPLGDQLVRLGGNLELKFDGINQILDNTTPIRGRYVAGAGHNTWFMYEFYYDELSNSSHLIKHGTWIGDPEGNVTTGLSRYIDVHHGSIYDWNKQVTAAAVIGGVHSATNDRLYVGFSDGSIQWAVLPRTSPDPSKDTECEFTGLDSYVYMPIHHAKFQADNKLWQGVSVFGPELTTTEWAEVEYRLAQDSLASWEPLTDENLSIYTLSGQRINFPDSPPIYSHQIAIRVKLVKSESLSESPANLTPVLDGIGIHGSVRPSLAITYNATIHAATYATKRNGTADRRRGTAIQMKLKNVAAQIGNIEITLPDGNTEEVAVIDYQENWRSQQNTRDLEYFIEMSFTQVKTISEVLVVLGLTYATLETYTLGELEDII